MKTAAVAGIRDELEKSLLAGFLDARSGEDDLGVSVRPGLGHGILVAADVFVIDEDFLYALIKC